MTEEGLRSIPPYNMNPKKECCSKMKRVKKIALIGWTLIVSLFAFVSCGGTNEGLTELPPFEVLYYGEEGGIYEQKSSDGVLEMIVNLQKIEDGRALFNVVCTWLKVPKSLYSDCLSIYVTQNTGLTFESDTKKVKYVYKQNGVDIFEEAPLENTEQVLSDDGSYIISWKFDLDENTPEDVSGKELQEITVSFSIEITADSHTNFNYGVTYDQGIKDKFDQTVGDVGRKLEAGYVAARKGIDFLRRSTISYQPYSIK